MRWSGEDPGRLTAARPRPRARRGITLPFIVLLVATFIGLAAFAIDFSRMWVIRNQLQRSADAGALAGGVELAGTRNAAAGDSATSYALRNLVERVSPDVGVGDVVSGHWNDTVFTPTASWTDPATNAVRVTTHHTGSYVFGVIYGRSGRTLDATATAALGSVSGTTCVRPLAIPYEAMLDVLFPGASPGVGYDLTDADVAVLKGATEADEILLKVGDASLSPSGGNFYAIREGPVVYANGTPGTPWSGANDYRRALSEPCEGLGELISTGDWVQAEQGNMQGPTRQGLAALCGASGQSFRCTPPVAMRIAIWDVASKTVASPMAFRVKYVGVFMATGFAQGTPDGITGYFSALHAPGTWTPNPGPLLKAALVR